MNVVLPVCPSVSSHPPDIRCVTTCPPPSVLRPQSPLSSRATSLSLDMTHSLLSGLLAALLLCSVACSPLTSETDSLNSREELLDSSDYQYEEYDNDRVRDNRLIVDMEEVEQNKPQIKSSQINLKRENLMNKTRRRRQAGGETGEEGSRESEPLLVEDPKGWGLAHVLGEVLLSQISVRTSRLILNVAGIASLVCLVIYIIGITYKLIKMHMGTYVREDPVFLKYK